VRAWNVFEAGAPLVETVSPDPVPTGTEVVVAVTHCGLCHSDLTLWRGIFDLGDRKLSIDAAGIRRPLTLGHEIVGRVVALGPEAEGVAIGDRRLVFPWVGCGTCAVCAGGDEHMCPTSRGIGIRAPGGFGSHVLVPHPRHLVDYGDLDPAVAATYACSGLTTWSAIAKAMPLPPDEPLVLIGAGGLGQQAIRILVALGHRAIVVVDVSPEKLAAAKAAGAHVTVDGRGDDLAPRLKAAIGGPARTIVDLVNDATSAPAAFAALGRGGRLIMVGMFGGAMSLPLMMMPLQGLTLLGSYVGSPAELRALLDLAKSGRLAPMPVTRVPRDEVMAAMIRLDEGRVDGRLVLETAF